MSLHPRSLTVVCAILWPGCVAAKNALAPPMNQYVTKVNYTLNQTLNFPDFTLRYTGQSKVVPPQYPRGFIYDNFVDKADNAEQKVSWTSGTGDIAPQKFSVTGQKFALELRSSDHFGQLKDDGLVISPVSTP